MCDTLNKKPTEDDYKRLAKTCFSIHKFFFFWVMTNTLKSSNKQHSSLITSHPSPYNTPHSPNFFSWHTEIFSFPLSHSPNMARKLIQNFPILFFYSILVNFLVLTMQDQPCPYPCYPPPTGPGSGTPTTGNPSPPATTLTPPSSSGSGSVSSYPPPTGYYSPPSENLPNYPAPPNGNNLYGPPPPDPILPYFPYYYRKPPHQTDNQSSATSIGKSMALITAANVLVFVFLFTSCLWS